MITKYNNYIKENIDNNFVYNEIYKFIYEYISYINIDGNSTFYYLTKMNGIQDKYLTFIHILDNKNNILVSIKLINKLISLYIYNKRNLLEYHVLSLKINYISAIKNILDDYYIKHFNNNNIDFTDIPIININNYLDCIEYKATKDINFLKQIEINVLNNKYYYILKKLIINRLEHLINANNFDLI